MEVSSNFCLPGDPGSSPRTDGSCPLAGLRESTERPMATAFTDTLAELQLSVSHVVDQHHHIQLLLDKHAEALRSGGNEIKFSGGTTNRDSAEKKTSKASKASWAKIPNEHYGIVPGLLSSSRSFDSEDSVEGIGTERTTKKAATEPVRKTALDHFMKAATAPTNHLMKAATAHFELAVTRTRKKSRNSAKVFPDAEEMKEAVREAIMRPEKGIADFYSETGLAQAVAKSPYFEFAMFIVIAMNTLWLGYEVSTNKAELLNDADIGYQVVEHFFCFVFVGEWIIRFTAFRHKVNCFKDNWFIFDTLLVLAMVLETWVLYIMIMFNSSSSNTGGGATSLLRIVRMVKMSRVARISRLFRAFPELMLIIKSLAVTFRTVSLILAVLASIIYIFGIIMVQVCKNSSLGDRWFPNVPTAMWSLTVGAIFPDMADFIDSLGRVNPFFAILFVAFTALSTIVVMNMLIGSIVELVGVVAAVEREENEVNAISEQLESVLNKFHCDQDQDGVISRSEFREVMGDPEAVRALHKVGVDALGLLELSDIVFRGRQNLRFRECLDLLLHLRANNYAKVKDLTDMRRYIHLLIAHVETSIRRLGSVNLAANQEQRDKNPALPSRFSEEGPMRDSVTSDDEDDDMAMAEKVMTSPIVPSFREQRASSIQVSSPVAKGIGYA